MDCSFARGANKSGSPQRSPWRAPFDSVFAPPAGLEPATGSLTPLSVPTIEDTVYLLARREQESPMRGTLQYRVSRQYVDNGRG